MGLVCSASNPRGTSGLRRHTLAARSGTPGRRHRHILFEYPKVSGAEVRVCGDRRQTIRRRRQYLTASGCCKRYWLALEIGEEKQFVLDNRPTKSAAVAVAVKTR